MDAILCPKGEGLNGTSNRASRCDHNHEAGTLDGGFSGTVTVVTDVIWSSPTLTKKQKVLTFLNGDLMSVGTETTTTVLTGEEC